jgi:hypothetical protein
MVTQTIRPKSRPNWPNRNKGSERTVEGKGAGHFRLTHPFEQNVGLRIAPNPVLTAPRTSALRRWRRWRSFNFAA